jgi:hypothetical protein
MTVELFTREGGFVARGRLPVFHFPPDVILWGTRVFIKPTVRVSGATAYVEARPARLVDVDDVFSAGQDV